MFNLRPISKLRQALSLLLSGYVYPRWHSHNPLSPGISGGEALPNARQLSEPLPDLEEQLAAELEGVSWAAVAFAPRDAAWCDWIYRNLNGYPLPASLVDRVTPHGYPRPDCLSIFPDRRDPASAGHAARALENSAYLIVVCSPRSLHSRPVEEQIRAFKNAGGEERIIALVVEGGPDEHLGEQPRAAQCDWLPPWLRWRLEEDGFRPADRSEPRVVDARPGYRSLKRVRDSLLTALADMDAGELERLGAFGRPVEMAPPAELITTESLLAVPALPSQPDPAARHSTYTVWTAVALIVLAVLFGTKSFMEITAEEPASTLATVPVTGLRAGRMAKQKAADPQPAPLIPEPDPAPEPPAPVLLAQLSPPPADPPRTAAPAPRPNVPQIAPPSAFATSRVEPPRSAPPLATAITPAPAVQDAVLLDEVKTLERRGDEIMSEHRVDDALDLYGTALDSALEYASRKESTVADKDHVVTLLRKVALLQNQNSSTAEARATFQQARKTLLKLKAQGSWTRERARTLDEMEARLVTLPRD